MNKNWAEKNTNNVRFIRKLYVTLEQSYLFTPKKNLTKKMKNKEENKIIMAIKKNYVLNARCDKHIQKI